MHLLHESGLTMNFSQGLNSWPLSYFDINMQLRHLGTLFTLEKKKGLCLHFQIRDVHKGVLVPATTSGLATHDIILCVSGTLIIMPIVQSTACQTQVSLPRTSTTTTTTTPMTLSRSRSRTPCSSRSVPVPCSMKCDRNE